MPLINRDLPAPSAWPPPRGSAPLFELLDYVRRRDPVGHRVHIAIAAVHLFTLPLLTAVKDITFAVLIAYALLRLPNTWRCYTPLLRDRAVWLLVIWAALFGLSILWSMDRVEGLTQFKAFRVILLPGALWPILEAAPLLIGSFLGGVFCVNVVQLGQRLQIFGLELRGADRARGMIHPIQSGAFALAAVAWYLVALIRFDIKRPRVWLGRSIPGLAVFVMLIVGAGAALGGLVFSGSRGSWLAALIVLPLAWLVLLVRLRDGRRRAWALLGVGVVLAGVVLAAGGGRYVLDRIEDTRRDLTRAEEGAAAGSVAQRLIIAEWAWRFFLQSPVFGNGAGAFREMSRQTPEFQRMELEQPLRAARDKFTPAHPHNAYLHMMTSTGAAGTLLFLALLGVLILRAWREPGEHLFVGGALWVLLGWMLGTMFDCYTLNGHLFGLFAFVMALTLPRPQMHAHIAESSRRTSVAA